MWVFFSTLVVMGTLIYALERVVVPGIFPRKPEAQPDPFPAGDDSNVVPSDLASQAAVYEDEWARDDALTRFLELRQQLGSWDGVRKALGRG